MKSFTAIVNDIHKDDLAAALTSATGNGYELFKFIDTSDNDSISYLLQETVTSKKGWGLYVFRVNASSKFIIEAPHPIYDTNTPRVAADLYRAIDARSLLIAGAHRDANSDGSADVAHNPQTIFQSIHAAEVKQSLGPQNSTVVMQIHGFASNKHPSYPQIVINFDAGGNKNPLDLARGQLLIIKLVHSMRAEGLHVATCSGGNWRDLCGEKNIQSELMTSGLFIHIELDETIRNSDKDFIKALKNALVP